MTEPTNKQMAYLQSIARECRIMKRDFAIGLPGDVSEYTVNQCIHAGWVTKEWRPCGTLDDGRKISDEVYRLTNEGTAIVEPPAPSEEANP